MTLTKKIEGAKHLGDRTILDTLDAAGFNIRQALGFQWDGDDCTFTQPPVMPTSGCKKCEPHTTPTK